MAPKAILGLIFPLKQVLSYSTPEQEKGSATTEDFIPMRAPKPQLLRDIILKECRNMERQSANDGYYSR